VNGLPPSQRKSGSARNLRTRDAFGLTSQKTWILRNDAVRQVSLASTGMSEAKFFFFYCDLLGFNAVCSSRYLPKFRTKTWTSPPRLITQSRRQYFFRLGKMALGWQSIRAVVRDMVTFKHRAHNSRF
jgi:hypothetical protein